MAKVHAIEGVFVMAGSVVNQDAGLGVAFATPGAEDVNSLTDLTCSCSDSRLPQFFADRCRADQNDILTHFKSHI